MADIASMKIEINMVPVNDAVDRLASIDGGRGEKYVKRLMRAAMQKARRKMVPIAREEMQTLNRTPGTVAKDLPRDPRQAYRAVRMNMYKRAIGANLSIMDKRKRSGGVSSYSPPSKYREGMRGGSHGRPVSGRTQQINGYHGSDRGFILRFTNSGTSGRKRGDIVGARWFWNTGNRLIEEASGEFAKMVEEAVTAIFDGKVSDASSEN